jgi:glycosyltransferase involved in cell wall biosynthesis
MKILVTHPGRQHSHQAAVGLERAGMLAGYWAGVPATAAQARRVPARLRQTFSRYAPVDLPAERVRWFPLTPALRRLGAAALPHDAAARLDLGACRLFDRWAAAALRRAAAGSWDANAGGGPPGAVIACEISALSTFRAARRLGLVTILDAPSLHRQAQDRLHGTTDSPALHRRIARIKDEEIALADHILTVSELARQTYVEAGVAPERVHAVPLGADLDLFTPGDGRREPRDELVFLFAGATLRRKGFDLLLDAFERARRVEPAIRLRVVGPRGDAWGLLAAAGGGTVEVAGPMRQEELAAELRAADCLVLPSRNDSYGMVVAEALASGTPVLVSDMVGAKELVAEGRNGWIVRAGDAAALAERMAWCAAHPAAVRALRGACRRSAAAATWPSYHARLAGLLRAIVPADRAS